MGNCVGESVGALVGTLVGVSVGDFVGDDVEFFVGLLVGQFPHVTLQTSPAGPVPPWESVFFVQILFIFTGSPDPASHSQDLKTG